jgi:hypothetical protein
MQRGMIYAYVGVSTAAQDETDQVQRLKSVEVRKDIPREDHGQDGRPAAAWQADERLAPGARELIDTLDRLDRAYQEFPGLALERPRSSLAPLMMLLLDQIVCEPLSALQWGEGGTRRASDGKVRWAAPQIGSPASLTPSAPPGQRGERAELSPTAEVSSLVRRLRELRWDAIDR